MPGPVRNLIRIFALLGGLGLVTFGLVNGAIPGKPKEPPSDSVWLICLGGAFLLFLIYAWLTASPPVGRYATLDARFRHNVRQLGAFLLVGFALLTLHLLREQIVVAVAIKDATVITAEGNVIQDPRKIPEELQTQRGAIVVGGDTIIAASEIISPSRYAHRIYPEPNISYLAGYYNPMIYGSAGLEASFDRYLSGSEVLNPLTEQQRRLLHRPVIGNDIYLTIDPHLQNFAQEQLGERKGSVVVVDAQTGAILALASWPHIDPQQLSFDPDAADWEVESKRIVDYYNGVVSDANNPLLMRATQGLYPPGSTFKTVTASAAIDTGAAQPLSVFTDTNGKVQVEAGNYLHVDCSTCRPRNHGPQFTLTEGYKWSLNVVFAELGVQLGGNRLIEYARRFGFGTHYDIGLPLEASRLASSDEAVQVSKNLLAATAYGQGEVQATPLQMALVAAAVARGGELPAPYMVSSVNDHETGQPVWQFQPHALQQVLSPNTDEAIKQMMITSVQTGWAKDAAIQGAIVGGKTGTAETGHDTSHSWFIGFAGKDPAKPQYAICTMIEEGGEGTRVALPLAKVVLEEALKRK
ncbi:MAG: penicillin-binding protein [Chloroflexia bacterium]|jgi:peptidoglycan glycosyltransferase|nr:penicillin-binding protein [Chloroflexia bacterium]